jgi:pimeloyl-ACP methyl ester carboxylesterase
VKPPLLLLHGLGTGPSGWRPQVEALADDRALLVPRLPLSLPAAEATVAALLDGGVQTDDCGLSLGALVGLLATLARPERVRRLVLAAGFARLPARLRMLQLTMSAATRAVPSRWVVRGLVGSVPAAHREEARGELAGVSSRAVASVMAEGARVDVAARVRRLGTPTLVICGQRDRLNLRLSRELESLLPNAELCVIPEAGHVVNLEQPAAFTHALRDFLDRA